MRGLDELIQDNARPARRLPIVPFGTRLLGRVTARLRSWLWTVENGSRAADRARVNRPWASA